MLFRPGENVWKIAHADRAAVLVDGGQYFGAVRAAMLRAEQSIFIAGWDIHSRTRLVGESGEPDDDLPAEFAGFLAALVERRPALNVCLLLWDYSLLYAFERDVFPTYTLRWNTPSAVRFCLDDGVPLGSSQHQKLVVVDDQVAFNGGLDLTIRRWDTSEHKFDNPHRVDPSGKPYPPFHDVQMAVDGEAARALGDLFRARWRNVAAEVLSAPRGDYDPWPAKLASDFTNVDVAIARTQPQFTGHDGIREVERFYYDAIDIAEQSIYIENQYLTVTGIAEHLAARLRAQPKLELLVVTPELQHSWLEASSMAAGRSCFAEALLQDEIANRVLFAFPTVSDDGRKTPKMVHSKLMIVDDKLLRIGSANLNNRSMGTDVECDLAILAADAEQRHAIAHIRDRLIGDHCGVAPEAVRDAIEKKGSMIAAALELTGNGHRLEPLDCAKPARDAISQQIWSVADPERPIGVEEFVDSMFGGYVNSRNRATVLKVAAAGIVALAFAAVWHFSPVASPDSVNEMIKSLSGSAWAPVAILASFLIGGFIMFPVTLLIAATAATFGPLLGMSYAFGGAMLSAVATFALGAAIGQRPLRDILGPRLNRVRKRIVKKGIIAVATIRLVPAAPFTVINLVAGASQIRMMDYLIGTAIGLLPGIATLSLLGHQMTRIMTEPTWLDFLLLAAGFACWVGLAIGVQAIVARVTKANA